MRTNLAAATLCLFQGLPVAASGCDGLADLLDFIATETVYPVPVTCPAIDRSDVLDGGPALRSQVGAYVPETGRILLASDLDTEAVLGRSYLLHELVHAAQYRAGMQTQVRCEAELEAEAYRIQTAWLRRQGEMREAMLLDWAAAELGRCPGAAPPVDY